VQYFNVFSIAEIIFQLISNTTGTCKHVIFHSISPLNFCIRIEFKVLIAVVMKGSIFWDITPFSSLKINRRLGGTFGAPYSDTSAMKMETKCSSETSVASQRTRQRYLALTFSNSLILSSR
jgi:hypothetical protein